MGGMINTKYLQDKIDKVVEILKLTADGKCALALAGAHAKGTADAESDIDIFMFTDCLKPYEERLEIIKGFTDEGKTPWLSESLDFPWGGGIEFYFEGTPVEVVVRTPALMEKRLEECINGHFEIIPQTWTSNGYYTYIYLSEVSFIKPVWDPDGLIDSYRSRINPYPSKLKKAIIDCFFSRANTWIYNFHYSSAIKRMDILFTSPIVLHTVLDIIQVVFAINEAYFIGDKKLEDALSKLDYCPVGLLGNIDFLLNAPRNAELLQQQCNILRGIIEEVSLKIKNIA